LINVKVRNNIALFGGGIYNSAATSVPTFINVEIVGNKAIQIQGTSGSGTGGGISNFGASTIKFRNAIIRDNHADVRGGGIQNAGSHPELTNVTISGNTSPAGAGMSNVAGSGI